MSWGLCLLKWVTGPGKRSAKKSRKPSLAPLGPHFRWLRLEPLEYRRLLTAPTITGVNPAFPVATGSAQSFTINGSNFQSGCTVTLLDLGTSPITTYPNRTISSQSATQIAINPNFGTAHDVWGVEVINPGSSSSNQFDFATTPASQPQPDRFGVDYSFARPTPSSLQAAGSTFAVRYVSPPGNGKNITSSEAQSLLAAGQDIILVFESTAQEMLNGYNAGVTDANTAVSVAAAAGAPSNFFCYFAADWDATQAQQTPIDAYLNGASSVLGLSRVGLYGGYWPVSRALTDGTASKGWQATAWSGGNVDSRISLFQFYLYSNFFSGNCDADVGFGSNLGQWAPATPTGLSASPTGIQTVSISWNTAYVATGYTLDRATSSSGPWTQVYSGANTSYADSGLQFGTKYYYEVCANNGGGSSAFSSAVSATTLSGVPTGLSASAAGPQSISVHWNTVTGATTYTLQRSTAQSGPWTQVYSNSSAQFSDSGLLVGTTYYYEVRSGTSTGTSAYSPAVSATTFKTITWTGGGANANWSTAANWGGMVPVAGCDLAFAASAGLTTSNDLAAGTQFGNLTFNAAAGAFTLNGNSVMLSGSITNNSTNAETINLSLGGSYGLTKTGSGSVVLSGANSFTGGTVVADGTLKVTNPAALPDGSNLSIGANVLTLLGAAVPAPAVNSASTAAAATSLALGTARTPSMNGAAVPAALVNHLARKAARSETWADMPNADGQQEENKLALRVWDAVFAEYVEN
jgi:autotransporter-associated beta strand protein